MNRIGLLTNVYPGSKFTFFQQSLCCDVETYIGTSLSDLNYSSKRRGNEYGSKAIQKKILNKAHVDSVSKSKRYFKSSSCLMKKIPYMLSNLMWRYFLNKVSSLHGNLRLILPQTGSLSLRSYQDRSGIRIYEQFRYIITTHKFGVI